MSIAAASLDNLIPNVPKWEGYKTAPVRVPEQLKDWVISMVNQRVQELRITIGVNSSAEQSEQSWANEVLGLPATHQPGDPLPDELVTAIAESKAERLGADNEQVQMEASTAAASAIAVNDVEPPTFTRAWLDWAAAKNPSFDERQYINWVKEEAAQNIPGAKNDLACLVADGVDIGQPLTSQSVSNASGRRQAKNARRLARQKKAAGGELQTSPALDRADKSNPLVEEYYRILPVYREQAAERLAEFNAFFEELEALKMMGKVRRFKGYLAQNFARPIEVSLSQPPLDLSDFLNSATRLDYSSAVTEAVDHLTQAFYSTDEQREESNLDGRFFQIVREIVFCWSMSAELATDR
jgi:hypothetical protein